MKKYIIITIFITLFLSVVFYQLNSLVEQMIVNQYKLNSSEMISKLKSHIDDKKNATLTMAISYSHNKELKEALKTNNPKLLKINDFLNDIESRTDFNNVWIHVVDKDGNSFQRSWSKKSGDNLLKIRKEVSKMIISPEVISTISVGIFDITFKAMVPIFENGEFLGIFEVITKFNSITKKLSDENIDAAIIVDKKYKQRIKIPFSKTFIQDYYIANIDLKKDIYEILNNIELTKFLSKNKKYFIINNNEYLNTQYILYDIDGSKMAYIQLFKKLSLIDMSNINSANLLFIISILITITAIIIVSIYISSRSYIKDIRSKNISLRKLNQELKHNIEALENQKLKTKTIFNVHPSITILTDGRSMRNVNEAFFEFFNQYSSLEEFKKEHDCICELFESYKEENYINLMDIGEKNCLKHVLKNPDTLFKAAIQKDGKLHHFIIVARSSKFKESGKYKSLIVVSLLEITKEVDLHQQMKIKDELLFQQSKMAAMGEMIGNIAHQWRQPLSIISSVATGMRLNKEYNKLEDDQFYKGCDTINNSTQYLSKTIDDFRNYFKTEKEKKEFTLNKIINNLKTLIEATLRNNHIELIIEIDEDIKLLSYENELTQAMINMFNNSIDALKETPYSEKYIFIKSFKEEDNLSIVIKDNGKGIPRDIIDRIFEPYFTTKHQSQGTGIGLYMTHQIITEHLKGTLDAKNVIYKYKGHEYKGVEFKISIPCKL